MAPTLDGSAQVPLGEEAVHGPVVSQAGRDHGDPVRVGRYVVLRRLGQGGMGVVYLAYDETLDRKVAIKVMSGSAEQGALAHERVMREAQSLAQVAHPNIVHVYEVGQSDGQIFIAMEYVRGDSLAHWQSPPAGTPRPSIEKILRVYLQAANGLYAAHGCGLIHRDFKPDNVLLDHDGRARVLDFGLARVSDRPASWSASWSGPSIEPSSRLISEERLTQIGAIVGTPGYMSPEQLRSAETDARSDQFSFCAALYEALYQRLPFAGETLDAYAEDVLAGRLRPPPPSEVPIAVEKAVLRGLETAPERRFPSMAELIQVLESGLHPDSESPVTRRANQRFKGLLAIMTVLTAAGGLRNGFDQGTANMAHAAMMIGVLLVSLVIALLLLRRTLLRRASYRRVAYSYLVNVTFLLFGRIFASMQGMELGRYASLEMLGLAALLAIDVPQASPKYRWLAALCFAGSVVTLFLPQLSVLLLTTIYPVLAVGGVYYRITEPSQREEPADAKSPGTQRPTAPT